MEYFFKTEQNNLKLGLRESAACVDSHRYLVFFPTPPELGDMMVGSWRRSLLGGRFQKIDTWGFGGKISTFEPNNDGF